MLLHDSPSSAAGSPEDDSEALTTLLGALDSPLRLRIISLLSERDHYVHELVQELQKSQPLISQHLRVLKKSQLVSFERRGRQVTYHLEHPEVLKLIGDARELAHQIL